MILQLPINQEGAQFQFSTELDGTTFGLLFRWNDRVGQWSMDVLDGEGVAIVTGIRVVLDVPLLSRYRGLAATPPGDIIAVDTSGTQTEAGFEDIGRRVVLYYLSQEEIA